jgi:AmmeMemoRadiSam system protein A
MKETPQLKLAEKRELIEIARDSIESMVMRTPRRYAGKPNGRLAEPGAAFVTLHMNDVLRGCIGTLEAAEPLYRAVASAAASAATRDPRFEAVTPEELARIKLEISVLTPRQRVTDVNEIVPGVHGLVVRMGMRAGLLLPQVATEYGWGREEFLANTCRKAGLPSDAWREPSCVIEAFSAEVFAEDAV